MTPDLLTLSRTATEAARKLQAAGRIKQVWIKGMSSFWMQRPEHGGNTISFLANGNGEPHADPWFNPVKGRWELVGYDLSDLLTAAGLILLVREAWKDPGVHVACNYGHTCWWPYRDGGTGPIVTGCDTELEALVAALVAAAERWGA